MLDLIEKVLKKYNKVFLIKGEYHLKKTSDQIEKLIELIPKYLN